MKKPNNSAYQFGENHFSLQQALGGPLGICESVLPTLIFISIYPFVSTILFPALIALAVSVLFAGYRLFTRSSLQQVLVGLLAVVIGVVWAAKTGQAENFFAFGFWINGVYSAGFALSMLFGYPVIGVLAAVAVGKFKVFRAHRRFYYYAQWATGAFCGLMLLRLVVELPLYYLSMTVALGLARIILGLPAFAYVAWVSWKMLKDPLEELKTFIPRGETNE